jgi:hypothetical protein
MNLDRNCKSEVEQFLKLGVITPAEYNAYCDRWNNDCVRFGPLMKKIPV